jgi:hypothetical protein
MHSVVDYQKETFRYDFVLSNWIFVWFLLYYVGAVPFSPLLAVLIGLACNTYEYVSKQKNESVAWRKNYILWNINIKILPVAILLARHNKIHWKKDLLVMVGLYILFLFWVYVNGKINPSYKALNPFNFNRKEQHLY